VLHTFALETFERVEACAFSPDGSALAAATNGGSVIVWDLAARKARFQFRPSGGVESLAFIPGAARLAVNKGLEGIGLYDSDTSKEVRSFGKDAVRSLAVAPDGRTLAAGDYDNRIRLWEVATGREVRALEGHRRVPVSGKNGVFCLAFSTRRQEAGLGAADGTVRLWAADNGKETACCEGHGGPVHAVAFAPDGKSLGSGGADNVPPPVGRPARGGRPGR